MILANKEEYMNNEVQPEGNFYNKYESSNPFEKSIMKNFYNSLYRSIDLLIDNSTFPPVNQAQMLDFPSKIIS